MNSTINLIICGIAGRMGQLIAAEALKNEQYSLLGGTVNPKGPLIQRPLSYFLGKDAPNILAAPSLEAVCKNIASLPKNCVVIDFSSPQAVPGNVAVAQKNGLAYFLGCTGLLESQQEKVRQAGTKIPVLIAPNASLGANLFAYLVRLGAKVFQSADVEILDIHHKGKRDAPSGTALALAQQVALGRGEEMQLAHRRLQNRPRRTGEIGMASLRGGLEKGEHRVFFFGENERIELCHQVSDRSVFAHGVLSAAKYLAAAKPGLYTMNDVLGIG